MCGEPIAAVLLPCVLFVVVWSPVVMEVMLRTASWLEMCRPFSPTSTSLRAWSVHLGS